MDGPVDTFSQTLGREALSQIARLLMSNDVGLTAAVERYWHAAAGHSLYERLAESLVQR